MVGWTTVASEETARELAQGLVKARLAACVQISSPITSVYVWQGKQEETQEWRLTVKFPSSNALALEEWLKAHHPYKVPQWVALQAQLVSLDYLQWALEAKPNG